MFDGASLDAAARAAGGAVRMAAIPTRVGIAAILAASLAACSSTGTGYVAEATPSPAPIPQVQTQPLPGVSGGTVGQTVGTGPVRVGAILPLTQNGAPSPIGQSLRDAALLAVDEYGSNDITLMIVDDHSTPEGAAQAAQQVLGAGAEVIVGPLFAADVREVARAAKSANKPVIAFSTDSSVASHGVYLLSFLIESYVDKIMEYAVARGKKSFAVLAPQTDYANVALAEFQSEAAKLGARVVTISRYAPGQPASAVQEIAGVAGQIDALFIPEQAEGMTIVNASLATSGIKAQILGTGVWNDPRVMKLSGLQGAWFAAPESAGFNGFAQKYKAKYNAAPLRLATLAYDAVTLVAALARTQGAQRYGEATLTNASGFIGADGVFRFHPEGQNDRGLAIMQINNGDATVLTPAPHSFPSG